MYICTDVFTYVNKCTFIYLDGDGITRSQLSQSDAQKELDGRRWDALEATEKS